jgi:hypothetical protein
LDSTHPGSCARRRRVNSPKRIALALSTVIIALVGCQRHNASDFWLLAKSYRVVLHLAQRPPLTPEQEASFAPVADSAVFILRPDSVRIDRAFGTYRGDTRHFPLVFSSVGDSTFLATRNGEHWETLLGGAAADAGIQLSGERSHDVVKGTWRSRASNAAHGDFTMTPGS